MYFNCIVPVAPVRSQPAHKAEMVSQLLFGEAVQVLDTAPGGWTKISGYYDGYEGWITANHINAIGNPQLGTYRLSSNYVNTVMLNETVMQVPFGTYIPQEHLALNTSKQLWDFSETSIAAAEPVQVDELVNIARLYLNTPYLWGGKTVWGIDCSGLVQQVYKWAGIQLPRDAWQQAEKGEALHFLMEARPGDVAFFDNEEGRIIHTGILLSGHSILHSSGKVRIDSIDTEGIVNSETGARTHHLRIVKRMW